jgi:hypothetical protein
MKTSTIRNCAIVSFAVLVCVAALIILFGFPKNQADATEKVIEIDLERLNEAIDVSCEEDRYLGFSSNPYDYISDGKNEYYNEIIALGIKALPALEKALAESEDNGLDKYILAIAIEEITGANVKEIEKSSGGWGNAKEFESKWLALKENAPERIEAIVDSGTLSDDEKAEQLEAYGVLAVPVLEGMIERGDLDESLAIRVQEQIDGFALTDTTREILVDSSGRFN